ncbi:unnamed protein product [Choristocarpus tenellus]
MLRDDSMSPRQTLQVKGSLPLKRFKAIGRIAQAFVILEHRSGKNKELTKDRPPAQAQDCPIVEDQRQRKRASFSYAEEAFRGVPLLTEHALCNDLDYEAGKLRRPWRDPVPSDDDYSMSIKVTKVDSFISHTWSRDRRDPMFTSNDEYESYKASELHGALVDLLAVQGKGSDSGKEHPVLVWVDKCCLPSDPTKRRSVVEKHFEHIIKNSDRLLVLASTSYFTRLWCVYEWGLFVVTHRNCCKAIKVCLAWLCRSENFQIPRMVHDIKCLSVKLLKCTESQDKEFITTSIKTRFNEVFLFEHMVKVSAICAMVMECTVLALEFDTPEFTDVEQAQLYLKQHLQWGKDKFEKPWADLAGKLGMSEVERGIAKFWDGVEMSLKFQVEVMKSSRGSMISLPLRPKLLSLVSMAADTHLFPLVMEARNAAMLSEDLEHDMLSAACVREGSFSSPYNPRRSSSVSSVGSWLEWS